MPLRKGRFFVFLDQTCTKTCTAKKKKALKHGGFKALRMC